MDTNTHEGYNIFVLQLVAKGGITADVIFNYKVLPQVTTELCYKESQIRLKNCIGVYHQWADNRLDLYVWYAWRGWCGWWVSHSVRMCSLNNMIEVCFSNREKFSKSTYVMFLIRIYPALYFILSISYTQLRVSPIWYSALQLSIEKEVGPVAFYCQSHTSELLVHLSHKHLS